MASLSRLNDRRSGKNLIGLVALFLAFAVASPVLLAQEWDHDHDRDHEDFESFKKLSAEWWQWALSIPTSVNPQLELAPKDPKEERCMVGQRGSVWFLAGVFGGGAATRTCSVPERKALFFPVINSLQFNSPGVCGLPSQNVSELRALAAPLIDGATALSATVDGIAIENLRRVKSEVFEVVLPAENVENAFGSPCGQQSTELVPAGVYSPAVDDGIYALLKPLTVGPHTLHFHADSPGFTQDVTYFLNVVSVLRK